MKTTVSTAMMRMNFGMIGPEQMTEIRGQTTEKSRGQVSREGAKNAK
jgi:hypothetical protein